MLRRPDNGTLGEIATTERIVPLDRSRTFITLSVVLYHSVINYTHYGIGGDRMRWIGFDLVVLFNDSYFMACMFLISGLFVHDSLVRRGPANFLECRAWRLGIPFLASIFLIMPIAYYRYYVSEFDVARFLWHMATVGPWSPGSAWFLPVLLAFDALAALGWAIAPGAFDALSRPIDALRERPASAFAAFLLFSAVIYLPMRLAFGDSSWLTAGHYPLVIQTSRILLYAGYFFTGVAIGAVKLREGMLSQTGALARRWLQWFATGLVFYAAIVFLVYVHRSGMVDLTSPPLWWHAAYGLAFALFSASMTFAVAAFFINFAKSSMRLLDAMQPSAYGIYLLHFIPLIWMQYFVSDPAWPAFVKFAIVFAGTLSSSWAATVALRKIPALARMI
jgi:surface polysaccharide O-acyltransferase-like enzyme